jgi:hypothetical protein
MPAETRPLNEYVLGPFTIADISTGSSVSTKLPVPMKGQVVGIKAMVTTTVTGTAVLTVRKNGAAMTGVALSCAATTGGDVESVRISPNLLTGYLEEDDEVDVISDGGSTNVSVAQVLVIIQK